MSITLSEKFSAMQKISIKNRSFSIEKIKKICKCKGKYYLLYDINKPQGYEVIEIDSQVFNFLGEVNVTSEIVLDNVLLSDGIIIQSGSNIQHYLLSQLTCVEYLYDFEGNLACYIKHNSETGEGFTQVDASLFAYLKQSGVKCFDNRLYTYYRASRNQSEGILLRDKYKRYIPYDLIQYIEKITCSDEEESCFKLIYRADFKPTTITNIEVPISGREAEKLMRKGFKINNKYEIQLVKNC